jgi:hypothetical protein
MTEYVTKFAVARLARWLMNSLTRKTAQQAVTWVIKEVTPQLVFTMTHAFTRDVQADTACKADPDSVVCKVNKADYYYADWYASYYSKYFEEHYSYHYGGYYADLFAMEALEPIFGHRAYGPIGVVGQGALPDNPSYDNENNPKVGDEMGYSAATFGSELLEKAKDNSAFG